MNIKYVHNNNKMYHFQIENSSNKPYSTSILNSAIKRVDKTIFQILRVRADKINAPSNILRWRPFLLLLIGTQWYQFS